MKHEQPTTVPTAAPELAERIVSILAEQTNTAPADFRRDLLWLELGDSLEQVEALMKLEEEFEMSFPDVDVERLRTVGDVIDYITARVAERAAV